MSLESGDSSFGFDDVMELADTMMTSPPQPETTPSGKTIGVRTKKQRSELVACKSAASVGRRNERERNRVKQVNLSFERLRQHVKLPGIAKKKLSKVDTLRAAVDKIMFLQSLITAADTAIAAQQPQQQQQQQYLEFSATNSDTELIDLSDVEPASFDIQTIQQLQLLVADNVASTQALSLDFLHLQQQQQQQQPLASPICSPTTPSTPFSSCSSSYSGVVGYCPQVVTDINDNNCYNQLQMQTSPVIFVNSPACFPLLQPPSAVYSDASVHIIDSLPHNLAPQQVSMCAAQISEQFQNANDAEISQLKDWLLQ